MNYKNKLAQRTKRLGSSAISEILKVVNQQGMISLAGGIPAPESFPMEILGKLCQQVIKKYQSGAFQYSDTQGFLPLRKALQVFLEQDRNMKIKIEHLSITTGSQGVLDNVAKVLIDRGDKIAVESPTYLGALQAFDAYEPEYVSMETDQYGLIPESMDKVLQENKVKFVYLVPTFQNPTGRTIPLNRRKEIASILRKHKTLLLEDDPYSALRYEGEKVDPIQTLVPNQVIYTSTMSKIFAPGLRVGFVIAPEEISRWLIQTKQGVDLHTSTFNQALAAEYISGGYLAKQLPKINNVYQPKQRAMLNALETYFPQGFNWSKPEGGMFIWVQGPKAMDMKEVYWAAIKEKVAFVPGEFFFVDPQQGKNTMRLNFSMVDEKTIDKAVKTLSKVLKKFINN